MVVIDISSIFAIPTRTFIARKSLPRLYVCHAKQEFESQAISSSGKSNFSCKAANTPHGEGSKSELIDSCLSSAIHNPTSWGTYFLSYTPHENEEILAKEHQVLKEHVRSELLSTAGRPLERLRLIDAIERLGVACHFNQLIEESLVELYHQYNKHGEDEHEDLYHSSLRFRLFRQHGIYISSDVFKKFTDENGDFPEHLRSDTLGILCLYEASHLRVHGEYILEKALTITTRHLRSITAQSTNPFFEAASHALMYPLQRTVVCLKARHHIASYEHDPLHSEALLLFAKRDFNKFQSLYKKELQELTRWWEEQNFAEKLPFARDRLVENYFLIIAILGVLVEPEYSLSRIISTKTFQFLTALDDIYDGHGTSEELKDFAEAIERWDKSCSQQLPDSVRACFETLLDVFEQVENDMVEAGMLNHVQLALEEVKTYSTGNFKGFMSREAKTAATYEEYLRHGVRAIGTACSIAILMMTMGDKVQKEDFECVSLFPDVIKATSIIGKLLNDIQGYETDKNDGRDSTLLCYMSQYGVSKDEACAELYNHVERAWIDINEEICLRPTSRMRRIIIHLSLNIARVGHTAYYDEDGFRTNKNLKEDIKRLFVDQIN